MALKGGTQMSTNIDMLTLVLASLLGVTWLGIFLVLSFWWGRETVRYHRSRYPRR